MQSILWPFRDSIRFLIFTLKLTLNRISPTVVNHRARN